MDRTRFRATQEGRTNVCLQSQTFGTTWATAAASVTADQTAAPDGTMTADLITEDGTTAAHGVNQTISVASNVPYALSVYYKASGRTWLRLFMDDGGGANLNQCYYNCTGASGTLGTASNGGTGANAAGIIIPLANSWYRCILTGQPATASTGSVRFLIRVTTGDATSSHAGNSSASGYVWGAQLEAGLFASKYIATTTTSLYRGTVGR